MGSQPSAPRLGGGEPRHQDESFHDARHAMTPRDGGGAGTSAAAVAGARPDRRIRFATHETESRPGGEQPPAAHADQGRAPPAGPVHGDAAPVRMPPPRRPSYVPPWQRRVGEGQPQPHAAPAPASGHHRPPVPTPQAAAVPEERQASPELPGGVRPSSPIFRVSTLRDDDVDASAFQHHERPPPPHGPRYVPPRRRPEKTRNPMAFCCILFWLLVIAVGVSILVVFLVYHPKSPQLSVTTATLNAGNIGTLDGGDAPALNADVTILAAFSNPNTKISVVLRYVQLDLYFEGSMIATTQVVVWAAPPLQEAPRGSVVRNVNLVASNVTVTQEDASVWQNATAKGGGPVVLQLAGRFRTQLVFGRWFRYKYWATPRCTLWLDPPPSGALRRARC